MEWRNEIVLRRIAADIGKVVDVKLEANGPSAYKAGRVKIELYMAVPLKLGTVTNWTSKKSWLEYKYKRLPHYSYVCGRMGHYTSHYVEFPHTDDNVEGLKYRFWLKVEAREYSLIRKLFYVGKKVEEEMEELKH